MFLLAAEQIATNFENILKNADSRVENYFLMRSPLAITIILASYVVFVLKIGPAWMKNRPPFNIDKLIIAYNLLQILVNGYIFFKGAQEYSTVSFICTPVDWSTTRSGLAMLNLQYAYALLKLSDLFDTVFFVLRKKNNQVTFLHVYHHLLMLMGAWFATKFYGGGQSYFIGMANLFVHCVMYFYYFLTAWNSNYKNNIWWKKYLTQLQIAQHCFIFMSLLVPLVNPYCAYSKWILGMYLLNTSIILHLFVQFYIKTYLKKSQKTK